MMLGQKRFDPNDPQYLGQVNTGAAMPMAPMANPLPTPTIAPPKEGHNWIGILADALSGLAGQGPIYAPMAERRRQEQTAFERGEEQYQLRRRNSLEDQKALLAYKATLPPDDQLTEYLNAAGVPPDQRPAIYRQKVDAMVAPPMMSAQGVDEQGNPVMRFFPRAQPVGAPTPGTVKNGYRFKGGNPGDPNAWEPVGGAGSGPRTFP